MSDSSKTCTFCGSLNVEKQSDFGTSVMVKQYFCLDCKSAFEWIKWGDEAELDVPGFLKDDQG